jgi:thiamine biosynthesis protein ThiS
MRVVVNGFEENIPIGTNLDELIDLFDHRDLSLIVEINHQFVSPADYAHKTLSEGDVVELILPAFGG